MKILAWDIETIPMVGFFWQMFQEITDHENIIKESSIICASWKFVDFGETESVSILDCKTRFKKSVYDDRHVIKKLHKVLQEADVLLAQNGDGFDLKIFNWRAKVHGLQPIPSIETIDTLKESRKVFRPPSHRLVYKGKSLGHGGKIHVDMKLWRDIAMADFGGDRKVAEAALNKMVEYNIRDVDLLEEVYLDERPYYKKHPNRMIYDHRDGCPMCGSKAYKKNGNTTKGNARYQRWECLNKKCGWDWCDSKAYMRVYTKPA